MNLKKILKNQIESIYNNLKPMIPVYVSTWQGIEKLYHTIVQEVINILIEYLNSDKSEYTYTPKIEKIDNEDVLYADGFEDAFMGYANVFNKTIAVYHTQICIKILMDRDKMSEEDSEEYMEFNVEGGWFGKTSPCFIDKIQ